MSISSYSNHIPFTKHLLLAVFCGIQFFTFGQTNERGVDTTILAKGRFTTSLYGFIESESISQNVNGTTVSLENDGYTIGTQSGYLFHQNMVLGINLWLKRAEASGINYNIKDERLNLGLWYRWYFFNRKDISLYLDFTPFFTSVHQDNLSNNVVVADSEQIKGTGWGVSPAVGFVYFLNRNVGFGMSLDYLYARVNTTRTNLFEQTSTDETLKSSKLRFNFNFQIYLDQFFL